jgi:hypothetical protein
MNNNPGSKSLGQIFHCNNRECYDGLRDNWFSSLRFFIRDSKIENETLISFKLLTKFIKLIGSRKYLGIVLGRNVTFFIRRKVFRGVKKFTNLKSFLTIKIGSVVFLSCCILNLKEAEDN